MDNRSPPLSRGSLSCCGWSRHLPLLMRSYSLSGKPGAACYRVSVKREAHGVAGAYIDDELQVGDIVHASAARGSFTLQPGDAPVVLLSAGIGVTPVLAMLHALAAEASTREIWWLYGARNGREHPFAAEARELLKRLPTITATSVTARPIPTIAPRSISTAPGTWIRPCSGNSICRTMATSISADRPRS